jgi:ABC-2 type transport system ATP-binding protein
LLGFMRPTTGTLQIGGLDPRSYVERNGIGYVSELMNVPPRWELRETLVRYALLSGIGSTELRSRVDAAIVRLGIEEHVGKRVKQLSKGNLQRLGIAQALLRDERVLIFDEPTHGLDPVWTLRFRDIVAELRADDRVVFIASHNLDELQRLADRVAIIDHGQLQRIVDVREGASVTDVAYRIVLAAGGDVVPSIFPGAMAVGVDEYDLPPMPLERLNSQLADLLARGGLVRSLAPTQSSLERAFRDAVADAHEDSA